MVLFPPEGSLHEPTVLKRPKKKKTIWDVFIVCTLGLTYGNSPKCKNIKHYCLNISISIYMLIKLVLRIQAVLPKYKHSHQMASIIFPPCSFHSSPSLILFHRLLSVVLYCVTGRTGIRRLMNDTAEKPDEANCSVPELSTQSKN